MKLIIIASFIVICSASLLGGRKISITEDGGIVLTAYNGKKIAINKKIGMNGERFVEIGIGGPNMQTKKIRINDDNEFVGNDDNNWEKNYGWPSNEQSDEDYRYKRGFKHVKFTQGDLVINILKQHQGNVDDATYLQLLNQIDQAVNRGQVNNIILYLLQNLNNDTPFDVDPFIVRYIEQTIVPTGQRNVLTSVGQINPVTNQLYRMNNLGNQQTICGNQDSVTCLLKLKLGMGGITTGQGYGVYGTLGNSGVGTTAVNPLIRQLLGNTGYNTANLLDELDDIVTTQQVLGGIAGVGGVAGVGEIGGVAGLGGLGRVGGLGEVGGLGGVGGLAGVGGITGFGGVGAGIVPLNANLNIWHALGRRNPYVVQRLVQNDLNNVLINRLYQQKLFGGNNGVYGGRGLGTGFTDFDLFNNVRVPQAVW